MRYLIILLLIAQFQIALGQSELTSYKFRVYLKDKQISEFANVDPLTFLSQKAIDRRKEQKAIIDSTDYPITVEYKKVISDLDVKIVAESKWFNTVVIQCEDSIQVGSIKKLNFVDSVQFVWRGKSQSHAERMRPRLDVVDCKEDTLMESYFGISDPQFSLHSAQQMHSAGFQGKGIDIAVIDAGFTNLDVIPCFAHSLIAGYENFVPNGRVFSSGDHGTKVVSTMAINLPNKMMGSAPHASYLLLRSEDEESEYPVEEDYWVAAIEYADSLGVKLINTSLGYSSFDDPTLNYTHKELTGNKSLISQAADAAFNKGILVVGSAGNEGNKPWIKITMPGDSKKMLTIGAVSLDSTISYFSSQGPTADGRIKPDLVSLGNKVATIGQTGSISFINGTSFSSPFLTGLIGSLWSVNPQLNRNELINIIKSSAHQFHNPDSIFGYGIPDFEIAFRNVLKTLRQESNSVVNDIMKLSVTKKGLLTITLNKSECEFNSYSLRVLDEDGNSVLYDNFESSTYVFTLSDRLKENNSELYVVVESPLKNSVLRIKI